LEIDRLYMLHLFLMRPLIYWYKSEWIRCEWVYHNFILTKKWSHGLHWFAFYFWLVWVKFPVCFCQRDSKMNLTFSFLSWRQTSGMRQSSSMFSWSVSSCNMQKLSKGWMPVENLKKKRKNEEIESINLISLLVRIIVVDVTRTSMLNVRKLFVNDWILRNKQKWNVKKSIAVFDRHLF